MRIRFTRLDQLLGWVLALGFFEIQGPLLAQPAPLEPLPATNLAPRSAAVAPILGQELIATGQVIRIYRYQLDEAYTALKATAASQGQTLPEGRRSQIERQLVEDLVNTELLMARATEADRAKGRETADKRLAEIKARWTSEEAFRRQLIALGMPYEQFVSRLVERATFAEVVGREVRDKIAISDDAAQKYYSDNRSRFSLPERVRLRQILFMTQDPQTRKRFTPEEKKEKRALADAILVRARAGEDFAQLAQDHSEDPGTRQKGGEVPPVARGQMAPEIEGAAFLLDPGAVSDVIETEFGYHILKLIEKLPARDISFADALKDIKSTLQEQELRQQLPVYLKKLQAEAGIRFLGLEP